MTAEPLSDEEARALVVVRELGAIDNAAYRNVNRTDTLNASVHLRRLRDIGLLAMKGSGSRTYYVPGPSLDVSVDQSGEKHASHATDTHQGKFNTPQAAPDTHQLRRPIDLSALPADLQARVPAPGTKPRSAVIRALLLDLCAWMPLSARELATVLGRQDHKHLVREFLTPMIAEGLLTYTIPTMEKHPEQRYVTPK